MVDWVTVRQLLPHYVALAVILLVVLTGLRLAVPDLSFWIRLGIALLIGLVYPPIVRALGYAPEVWE